MLGGNNKQHARFPTPPTHGHTHVDSGRRPGTWKPKDRAAPLAAAERSCPAGSVLTAANVTLVNGDVAAVSITVNQRVLSPASFVRTHAATSNHFPHASPIRRNAFLLPAAAQTSRGPVRWSPGTLAPHWTYSLAAIVAQFLAQRRDEVTAWGLWYRCYVFSVMSSSSSDVIQCACAHWRRNKSKWCNFCWRERSSHRLFYRDIVRVLTALFPYAACCHFLSYFLKFS